MGASGSGKSTLLRAILRGVFLLPLPGISEDHKHPPAIPSGCTVSRARILAFFPWGDPPGPVISSLKDLDHHRSRILTVRDPDRYISFFSSILQAGKTVLVIDEAQEVFPREKPNRTAIKMLKEGRNQGITILWATPRPTECAVSLLSLSQGMIAGRLLGPSDGTICRRWGIRQPLPQYTFSVRLPNYEGEIDDYGNEHSRAILSPPFPGKIPPDRIRQAVQKVRT